MNGESIPQWRCRGCGRTLDDHQHRNPDGTWRTQPACIEPGKITAGIKGWPA